MIRLTPDDRTRREVAAFVRLADDLGSPGADAIRPVQETLRAAFDLAFEREGSAAPWADLAPFTVRERRRLGFPGEHPILQRTGQYRRSFSEEDHPDHVSEWEAAAGIWQITEGSQDERAAELEEGRWNMPPRPVTDLGPAGESLIAITLETMFDAWFEETTA